MLAIAATALLLSSCGTQRTLLKRHYNKGYYLSNRSSQPTVSTQQQEPSRKVHNMPAQPTVSPVIATHEEVAQNTQQAQTTTTSSYKKEQPAASKKKVLLQQLVTGQAFRQDRAISKGKEVNKLPVRADDRDGLSLFWVVILIIIILWAIGFFAGWGSGGLINLLLVVALILLILWLLRII